MDPILLHVFIWMHGNNTKSRFVITMESPIMDPPRGGHNGNDLSTKEMLHGPKCYHFPILLLHFEPSEEQTTSLQRTNGWPQHVLCSEVPLFSWKC